MLNDVCKEVGVCDYYYRVSDYNYYSEEDLEEMEDVEEGEIFYRCKSVPVPKLDLIDIVHCHINDFILEADLLDEEILIGINKTLSNYIQTRYFFFEEDKNDVFEVVGGVLTKKEIDKTEE
jgi:hypothetical protein